MPKSVRDEGGHTTSEGVAIHMAIDRMYNADIGKGVKSWEG